MNQRVVFASMAGTRFTPELNLDGLSPDEAFAVLGNEIRLDIIRVLWHADAAHEYDDVTDTVKTISFSKLRHQVDLDDNGRFNYTSHSSPLTLFGTTQSVPVVSVPNKVRGEL